ncbi:hypothetical protein [Streptosporangium sandarakinum]|uniref:hypothetical protein n=1 Tax=Streptosporangium sandarakinum TaxID=1260955 RepID=UPI00339FDB28
MSVPSSAVSSHPPLNVRVHTPRLTLAGASDELLERLVPVVRKGGERWTAVRRDDIELVGVAECRPVLGIGGGDG